MSERDHEPAPLPKDEIDRIIREQMKRPLPRRFYKEVSVAPRDGGFAILLDGRPVRTPLKQLLLLPRAPLADAVAAEWQAQGEHIDPAVMPLTKLANTAIDRVAGPERQRIHDEIAGFAANDLLCYFADSPAELVRRQNAAWSPVLAWAAADLGARFVTATGVMHQPQPPEAIAAVRAGLARLGEHELCAAHNLATLTGSTLIALALALGGSLGADDAWAAAHVDEDWQIEHWGEDAEAMQRRVLRRAEFDATLSYLTLAR